jgi:hypothetical protein
MKKIIYLVMAIVMSAIVSGCAGAKPKLEVKDNNPHIRKVLVAGQDSYEFYGFYKRKYEDRLNELKHTMHYIAEFGLDHGYKYMGITNEYFNNFGLYAVNDWNTMNQMFTLYLSNPNSNFKVGPSSKGDKGLLMNSSPYVKVIYFKEAHPGLFLWDLKKLKRETSH